MVWVVMTIQYSDYPYVELVADTLKLVCKELDIQFSEVTKNGDYYEWEGEDDYGYEMS